MPYFDEYALELSIMEMFAESGYQHVHGNEIHREKSDVLIADDLRLYLADRYAAEGITKTEIDSVLLVLRSVSGSVYESNKATFKMIANGFILNRMDRTQKDFLVEFIDFANADNNIFKIVNQVEIQGYEFRIPDAIVYVNGLPLVVLEFKSAVKENTTIANAYDQLTIRYKRDIPELFKYNAFVVISDGANNKYGSLFSQYDFFYSWRKIDDDAPEVDGIPSLVSMVKGLFCKDRFLNVVKHYVYFPDNAESELKVVCRYPQFFAAEKLLRSIKAHIRPDGDGKGGTYFGATGCGKSFTMLFLTRLLMKDIFFKSPTIILITDRTNVICISDEAHRSQVNLDQKVVIRAEGIQRTYGFAKYLHDSLPNATYVGFTGTPIDATIEVFGAVVDSYTMTESVKDGITVNLVYDGRAAKVTLNEERLHEIEEYYAQCEAQGANEHQIEESQKAVAHLDVIIGDPDRLRAVAADFIAHYETRVRESATVAGKAMFVCSDRNIAYDLYKIIIEMRPEWAVSKICADSEEITDAELKKLKESPMIQMVMTRNKDDKEELYKLLGTKDDRKELDRQFKQVKSNFKIAIVVDMWLTGFDVPCLDTIYIDKPVQQHSLIQTISRVNRVYEGKDKGLIVDYIGIKNNMNKALAKYTNFKAEEFEGVEQSVTIVRDQLEVLAQMFHNFNQEDFYSGTPKQQLDCLNRAVEYVQLQPSKR